MKYHSTRDKSKSLTGGEAIIKGISEDGGLFVPESFPMLPDLKTMLEMSYQGIAQLILELYLTDFTSDEIKKAVAQAYDSKFETEWIVPLAVKGDAVFLELFHGPTFAFKDMALSILPYLLKTALEKSGIKEEIVILVATSGDTGKAALEGFKDVQGTKVIVFFPEEGVSPIQRKQMLTQEGENTFVVRLNGNFDDAQNGVKKMFGDEEFNQLLSENGFVLSSANSINIGRLIPQIIYYVYGYLQLIKENVIRMGDSVNVAVPTGNFGNILAAYYAKEMGLPISKLICASNDNRILTDFFQSGTYDRRRKLMTTSSPSMDILISSNLERFMYHTSGEDESLIREKMDELSNDGVYRYQSEGDIVYPDMATEEEISYWIEFLHKKEDYIMDPHTAVAYCAYKKYCDQSADRNVTMIASTASPYKFSDKVLKSIGVEFTGCDEFEKLNLLSERMHTPVPDKLAELELLPIKHDHISDTGNMKEVTLKLLKGGV
ncbi:MAG: threonine synthase [Clostridia bacterium]|nr:threonine synthase [Clostridia bacterium]